MSNKSQLDKIRQSVLNSVEESQRRFRQAMIGFAVIEATCWVTYIVLAIYSFSLPVLIGVAAAAVYVMVSCGIMGVKLHIDACTNRILTSVELLADDEFSVEREDSVDPS